MTAILIVILNACFIGILSFQIFYILNVIIITLKTRDAIPETGAVNEKISILIPLFNCEKTIDKCLDSITQNNRCIIKSIIVVLDHCSDDSFKIVSSYTGKFQTLGIDFIISNLPENVTGKVNAVKHGIGFTNTNNIALIDADIILKEDALEKLLYFHLHNENSFSSCLIYPYQQSQNSFISKIICQDRLYRQNIIKTVKNKYGVANFPGSVGIVNADKYKKFLFSGFLEDLTASLHIIVVKEKIEIMPMILAYEFERQSLKGLFFQRTRWSIGNIENLPLLIKTASSEKNIFKKFLMVSYPVMWYLQHYAIVLGIILFALFNFGLIGILPFILYLLQIIISDYLSRKNYKYKISEIIAHCILFPIIITASLFGGIVLIIKNRKLYFKTEALFKRI